MRKVDCETTTAPVTGSFSGRSFTSICCCVSEGYALLAGSVGLFIVLTAVMYITRRMNWYELKLGNPAV